LRKSGDRNAELPHTFLQAVISTACELCKPARHYNIFLAWGRAGAARACDVVNCVSASGDDDGSVAEAVAITREVPAPVLRRTPTTLTRSQPQLMFDFWLARESCCFSASNHRCRSNYRGPLSSGAQAQVLTRLFPFIWPIIRR
jgi:hypothetical protein